MDRVEVVVDDIADREEMKHVQYILDGHRSATVTTRSTKTKTKMKRTFLLKLHTMLQDARSKGFDHIISWSKHNTNEHEKNLTGLGPPAVLFCSSFVIHQPKLMPLILSQYFRSSLYKSFCRRLQEYNFTRKKNVVTVVAAERAAHTATVFAKEQQDKQEAAAAAADGE